MAEWQPIDTAPIEEFERQARQEPTVQRVWLRGDGWEKIGRWFCSHEQALYDGGHEDQYSPFWMGEDGEEDLEPTHWRTIDEHEEKERG